MTLTTKMEIWGPEEAKLALTANTQNRPVRRNHVESLANSIKKGEWRLTHQGVAFDVNGRLVDGQHRAMAIASSGMSVAIMVTRGVPEDAYMAMDCGERRSNSDILSIPKRVVEVATLAARVSTGAWSGKISAFTAEKYLAVIADPLLRILSVAPTTRRYMSSAGMKLSATLHVLAGGDEEYVTRVYAALVNLDIDGLPPVGRSLVSQVMSGTAKSGGGGYAAIDTISRGVVVFNKASMDFKKLIVKDSQTSLNWARDVLERATAK